MPYMAKDGISDCERLCDPKNGYSVSCSNICPGYILSTTFPTTVTLLSSVDSDSSLSLSSWLLIIIAIVTFLAVIAVCYNKRQRVCELVRKLQCNISNGRDSDESRHNRETITVTKPNNSPIISTEVDTLLTVVNGRNPPGQRMLNEREHQTEPNILNVRLRDGDRTNSTGNTPIQNGMVPRESGGRRNGEYVDIQGIQRANKGATYVNIDEIQRRVGPVVNNDNNNTIEFGSTKPCDHSLPNVRKSSSGSSRHRIQETKSSVDEMSFNGAESRDHDSVEDSQVVTMVATLKLPKVLKT